MNGASTAPRTAHRSFFTPAQQLLFSDKKKEEETKPADAAPEPAGENRKPDEPGKQDA